MLMMALLVFTACGLGFGDDDDDDDDDKKTEQSDSKKDKDKDEDKDEDKDTEEEEQILEAGYYRISDSDNKVTGYLRLTYDKIYFYDLSGEETSKESYKYKAKKTSYELEGGNVLAIEKTSSHIFMTDEDEGAEYQLKKIKKSELGADAVTPTPTATPTPEAPKKLSSREVYNLASVSTVNITAYVSDSFYYIGTGFFDDENGTVITNYHVIDGTVGAYITTSDGVDYEVTEVLGYDADRDIAILATEMKNSIPLVKREEPAVTGETVYALGSSLGLSGTFSDGIVSSANRKDGDYFYIQYTAAISHGNSGGPLLDEMGHVIGIVCSYYEDGQNLNLAIPIADVYNVSRYAPMTLKEVYDYNYGTPVTPAAPEDKWQNTYIAMTGDSSHYITAYIPESFLDSLEVNDEGTGSTFTYETDNTFITVVSDISVDDYSYLTEEDMEEISNELTKLLSDQLKEYDFQVGNTDSTGATINDKYWRSYSVSGYADEGEINSYMLVYVSDNVVGYVLVETMIAYDADKDANIAAMEEMARTIISSLNVQ